MARSYKMKTFPTLCLWEPLHKQIIEKYEKYHNKAEFIRKALEYFAECGFPGIPTVQVESTVIIPEVKDGSGVQELAHEEEDTVQQMEEELEGLFLGVGSIV